MNHEQTLLKTGDYVGATMHCAYVAIQISFERSFQTTMRALKRLFTSVSPNVPIEVSRLEKGLGTIRAF